MKEQKTEFGVKRSHLKFKWGVLRDIDFDIEIEIATFKKIIEENEKLLTRINDELTRALNKEMSNSDDPETNSYCYQKYGSDQLIISKMKERHRFSVLISLIAFFEGTLKELCEKINGQFSPVKGKKDSSFLMSIYLSLKNCLKNKPKRKQDDLKAYWQLITKTIKVEKKNSKKYYDRIMEKRKILRNPVTHANGKIKNAHIPMINRTAGLSLTDNKQYFYISDVRFLFELLDEIEIFFQNLLKEIDE